MSAAPSRKTRNRGGIRTTEQTRVATSSQPLARAAVEPDSAASSMSQSKRTPLAASRQAGASAPQLIGSGPDPHPPCFASRGVAYHLRVRLTAGCSSSTYKRFSSAATMGRNASGFSASLALAALSSKEAKDPCDRLLTNLENGASLADRAPLTCCSNPSATLPAARGQAPRRQAPRAGEASRGGRERGRSSTHLLAAALIPSASCPLRKAHRRRSGRSTPGRGPGRYRRRLPRRRLPTAGHRQSALGPRSDSAALRRADSNTQTPASARSARAAFAEAVSWASMGTSAQTEGPSREIVPEASAAQAA